MKIKQIIADAAAILGHSDVAGLVKNNATEEQLQSNANYGILFRCANLVAGNIAGNYVTCIEKQTFVTLDGIIDLSQFKKTFLKVIDITIGGRSVAYELYLGYIKTREGPVEITYACIPQFKTGDDNAAVFGRGSTGLLTYGILSEYAFISGMFNEGKIWNERFGELLFASTRTGKATRLPS